MSGKKSIITEAQANTIRQTAKDDPHKALKDLQAVVKVNAGIKQARHFSIDAITNTTKRRTPQRIVGSLDQEFSSDFDRRTLIATARDIFLNFSFGKGILRQHIKNVIGIGPRLQATTADDEFNKRAEEYWTQKKDRMDITGKSFSGTMRVGEQSEVVEGDYGIMLLRGGKTQFIEGDRIADPPGSKQQKNRIYVNGVELTKAGTPVAYHIYNRGKNPGQMKYAKRVEADNFIHCFRAERFDQARGMSWLTSAVNDLQDLRETLDAVKGKWKLDNVLGIAITSDAPESNELASLWGDLTQFDSTNSDGNTEDRYQVKLEQGINSFELRPGEKVQSIESNTPNNNFEPFTLLLIRMISLVLDMPLEIALQYFTRGSYSGHRASFLQYFESVKGRRAEIEQTRLNRQYRWTIMRGIKAGELKPPKPGVVPDSTSHEWQWPGLPMLDADAERRGDREGYKLAVESLSSITGRDGKFWQDVSLQRIKEIKWIIAACEKEGIDPCYVLPIAADSGQEPIGKTCEENNNTDTGDEE